MRDHTLNSMSNQVVSIDLNTEELQFLIIGGGNRGWQQLRAILSSAPRTCITVVSNDFTDDFLSFAELHENVILEQRVFDERDLIPVDVVICATSNADFNTEIQFLANEAGILFCAPGFHGLSDFKISQTEEKNGYEHLKRFYPNDKTSQGISRPWYLFSPYKFAVYLIGVLCIMVAGHIVFELVPFQTIWNFTSENIAALDSDFVYFIIGGFIAQMIDGALGMAYGVTASTYLLSFGVSPAVASMSVHVSEIFTSGVSGFMHLRFGNVNNKLFKSIVLPGVLGAMVGAYLLTELEGYTQFIRPIVSGYTLFLGGLIIYKVIRKRQTRKKVTRAGWLATAGGFLDSIGGGGWGPVVSSTLIARGKHPRMIIGSVNLAEFFVSLASSFTFFTVLGSVVWEPILGLILGGICATPIAAYLSSKLNVKVMMLIVGIVVVIVSLRNVLSTFF